MIASVAGKDAVYEVVGPLGEPVMTGITMAPRLNTLEGKTICEIWLEGKTICEIWNGGFRGDESFPMIEGMLRERYPTVRMIPYSEFPLVTIASLHPEKKQETLEALLAKIKGKGCDAVITGNGC
jgi:hypothetical protein